MNNLYNAIVFKTGLVIWITQAEADFINHSLLTGERFVLIARFRQTHNVDSFSYMGIHSAFLHSTVRADGFIVKFAATGMVATDADGTNYVWKGNSEGWVSTPDTLPPAVSFEDLIASQTIA